MLQTGNRRTRTGDDQGSDDSADLDRNVKLLRFATGKGRKDNRASGRGRGSGSRRGGRGRTAGRTGKISETISNDDDSIKIPLKRTSKVIDDVVGSESSKHQKLDEDDAGVAGAKETDLMQSWAGVVADQLGPVPATSACALPSSSSSHSKSKQKETENKGVNPTNPGVPIESYTHPWRDSKGYCWVYNP